MATGEFGSLIDSLEIGQYAVLPKSVLHVTGDIYVYSEMSYPIVHTFSCTSEGVFGDNWLDTLNLGGSGGGSGLGIFHISGNVFGLVYCLVTSGATNRYYTRVSTFSVDGSGNISAIASASIYGNGTSTYKLIMNDAQSAALHVNGTTYVVAGQSLSFLRVVSFTVNDDGTSPAAASSYPFDWSAYGSFQYHTYGEVTDNVFVFFCDVGSYVRGVTFSVAGGGAIGLLDHQVVDGGIVNGEMGSCKVSSTVWAIGYCIDDGGTKQRIKTLSVALDGTIGAGIDEDDTMFTRQRCYHLTNYSMFILSTWSDGSSSECKTFSIAADGTIGSIISSAGGWGNYILGAMWTGIGELFLVFGYYYTGGNPTSFYSYMVEIPEPEVETLGYSDVKYNRATLWGNIVEVGMGDLYGFEWSLSSGSFENEESWADPQNGVFSADLTGLTYFTSYKFRAFVEADGIRYYGDTRGFITAYPIPEVETAIPVATGDDYITVVGQVWDSDGVIIEEYGFVFGYEQIDDTEGSFAYTDPPEDTGYDFQKTIEAAIGSSYLANDAASGQKVVEVENVLGFVESALLSGNAASGQKVIAVPDVTGYSVGMNVRIKDDAAQEDNVIAEINEDDLEITMLNNLANTYTTAANAWVGQIVHLTDDASDEAAVVDSISGSELTMKNNLTSSYTTAEDARIYSEFTIKLGQLSYGRRYYYRAYAKNSYGYIYGSEMVALTSDTVNLLYPTATASKGIRFCIPGKLNFPPSGMYYDTRHHLLVRSADSYYQAGGAFGWVIGKYVAERQYWGEATNVDLYTMSNPTKRDGTVIKVKYKARVGNNSYGIGSYHKRVINNGASSLTSAYISGSGNPGWYCEVFYDNPWTSGAWAVTEIDDLLMGISIRSGTGWETPLCDCIEGRVCWANAAVTTLPGESLTETTAKLYGQVTEDEAEDCEVFFEWGETAGYGSETDPQAAIKGQYFNDTITGLDPTKLYHYRAVITTACGETFYGEDRIIGQDRIYCWLGDSAEDEQVELTSPSYPTVLYARTERGWDEELAQASAGIAELVCDNFYGDYNPENAGGQYYGDLVLGKWLTVYEIYQGVTYKHFTGKIQKILPNDDHDNPTAYILAVDGMDDIAATKVSTVLRQDTDVGELANDALDACNWDAGKRDIDTGVDILEFGWFHKKPGLDAFRNLETTEKGRFFIKRDGDARFENRHYRITGDGLISQHTFDNTAVRISYEWSKRLLYNDVQVTGRRYTAGGVQLFSGYDMATLESALVWSAHTGDAAAPYVPQSSTLVLWAEFGSPISSYEALVKGTHWNANTEPDKIGDDVSDNITITVTQYGQALKLEIENAGTMGAYIVEPDAPPEAAEDKTLLIYGVLFGSENMTIIEEDGDSQDAYGKRTLEIDAPFKSKPNDILAYAQWLLARYHLPIPNPVQVMHVARAGWPDDTLRIQCLVREISDRITVASTKLGFDRDFYINKVIQEYAMNEGGMVHDTTWVVEQAEGSAEGLYWLLGVAGFGELGEATILGF